MDLTYKARHGTTLGIVGIKRGRLTHLPDWVVNRTTFIHEWPRSIPDRRMNRMYIRKG